MSHVLTLIEVARQGSFTRAAQSLGLTQPAVTQHVQALERELGVTILDRSPRGVRLTDAGRVLHRHLQDGLASFDRAKSAVQAVEAGITGHVTIGCSVMLDGSGIARCLRRLREAHPGISVTARIGRSETIVSLVLDGQLDLGIAVATTPPRALRVTPLYLQKFVLVTPPDHVFAGKTINARQASSLPMVGSAPGPWVGIESGIGAAPAVQTETLESIKALVIAGLGCALLPEHDVQSDIAAGRMGLATLKKPAPPTRMVSMFWRRDTTHGAGARALIRILREHFPLARS